MIGYIHKLMTKLATDTRGLTAVEYAVLGAIVVGAIVAATATFQGDLTAAFTKILAPTK